MSRLTRTLRQLNGNLCLYYEGCTCWQEKRAPSNNPTPFYLCDIRNKIPNCGNLDNFSMRAIGFRFLFVNHCCVRSSWIEMTQIGRTRKVWKTSYLRVTVTSNVEMVVKTRNIWPLTDRFLLIRSSVRYSKNNCSCLWHWSFSIHHLLLVGQLLWANKAWLGLTINSPCSVALNRALNEVQLRVGNKYR